MLTKEQKEEGIGLLFSNASRIDQLTGETLQAAIKAIATAIETRLDALLTRVLEWSVDQLQQAISATEAQLATLKALLEANTIPEETKLPRPEPEPSTEPIEPSTEPSTPATEPSTEPSTPAVEQILPVTRAESQRTPNAS